MSAVFKNAKKKVSQIELRKYMNEHKSKLKPVQKIESPLARYNDVGQLTCVLCKSVVRSEAVWKVHLNAKQHKENVELAKKLKEQSSNSQAAKRPASPENNPAKKIKSILKNSSSSKEEGIPDDFFDNKTSVKKVEIANKPKEIVQDEAKEEKSEVLPEGFFDDPKLDAKARNLEYKDPVEEEWERFQKELKEVDHKSAEIIAEDQEEATTERQIDEIEEQMRNWSRVLDLEQKKKVVTIQTSEDAKMDVSEDEAEDDEDFDEFLDWRAKKSFK